MVHALIQLRDDVGCRKLPSWRPCVQDSSKENDHAKPALGIAFVDAPQQAQAGDCFSCSFHVLAWPDPVADWLYRVGSTFLVLEGANIVADGRVESVEMGPQRQGNMASPTR
jgi:hypothetical protein